MTVVDPGPATSTGGLDAIVDVLHRAAAGDFEARTAESDDPALDEAGRALNSLLDVVDAFVRESGAALAASARGRFHRTFVERGLPGAYRDGARRINDARDLLRAADEAATEEAEVRSVIVAQAVEVSQHVAAASTELGASAQSLRGTVSAGVDELGTTVDLVHRLEDASTRIDEAVTLILEVASRTRLLALNATIEAARAGEHGKAFGVVADEVRQLSDRVAASSADISAQVDEAQAVSREVSTSISRVAALIAEIDAEATGVSSAAGHAEGGLARMAESLRADIGRFAE
ncbi:methyl-accepting chemotaxis protein [Cellulomonas sp.]|uniref:methyl-accepting chemotaxis protein n=1 Tax=Cellulomonas sp. TaxID=40001 RepID=UPI001B179CDC|nr:methyl-accepting chemotaxis protein [Cellulomonas sp.]MBO9553506.1 hypothetical protein [Cellulomonas sp.]